MKKVLVCMVIMLCFCPVPVFAQQDDAEKNELLQRIQDLEKRVNELTEEQRARRKLEITEQEKQETEKEVLEAVSREYTLDPRHTLNLDYSLNYSYQPFERYDRLQEDLDRIADHSLTHTIAASYSVLDNLTLNSSIPFLYQYKDIGTDDELDETDIGDISLGVLFQPFKSKAGEIATTMSITASLPTGRSPYEVNSATELSTGNGVYAFSLSANFSKQVDPVVVFWNVGYTHSLEAAGFEWNAAEDVIVDKVEKGDSIRFGGGFGQALSYKISVNYSFSYTYHYSTKYHFVGSSQYDTGDSVDASLNLGMGWRVSREIRLSFGVGYSLTGSGVSLTFRMPFSYIL